MADDGPTFLAGGPPHGNTQPPAQPYGAYPPAPPPGAQPVRDRRRGVVVILSVLAVMAIVGIIASSNGGTPTGPVNSGFVNVVYDITGDADSVSVTARSPTGTEQRSQRAVPFSMVYQMQSGDVAVVLAQNEGASGDVTCTITVDGQVVSTNTGSGAYTIASCNGRVP